jgi:glyoxylase-like metal-dependent hydrolase (beta-lactamase superfamily II)
MRPTILFSAGAFSLLLFLGLRHWAPEPAAQQGLAGVEIKATHVAGSVHMLEGRGGNIGISAGDDGVLMIDDQFAELEPKIKEAIAKISPKPIRFLFNTHFHGDHTGGNEKFGAASTILAHMNVRKRLEGGTGGKTMAKDGLPIITYDDGVSVHFNGEEIRVFHLPHCHTDGDSLVYFTKSNVVHTGDLYFSGMFPFIDLDGGGSAKGLIAGVEAALERIPADARVIPGHGPVGDTAGLKQYLKFLKDTRGLVAAAVKAGKSLDDMKKANLLKDYEKYSWSFVRTDAFLATLYRDVTSEK